MKILSFDVGINNLGYCIIECNNNILSLLDWNIIDISDKKTYCSNNNNNIKCEIVANFKDSNNNYYCKKHSKNTKFLFPTSELTTTSLKSKSLNELLELAKKYDIEITNIKNKLTKTNVLVQINNYKNQNMLINLKSKKPKYSIINICKNINLYFNSIFKDDYDIILIENQIGPLAVKMKSIQGIITQYFIAKNNNNNIIYVSSINKINKFINDKTIKLTYKERKKKAIEITENELNKNPNLIRWLDFFYNNNKKDDLADCFLQGLWYCLENKITINN